MQTWSLNLKNNWGYYLLWALVGVLFFPVLRILYSQRWATLNYTHAYFILPVSLGFVYWKRRELTEVFAPAERRFSLPSLAIFIFGTLLYLFLAGGKDNRTY